MRAEVGFPLGDGCLVPVMEAVCRIDRGDGVVGLDVDDVVDFKSYGFPVGEEGNRTLLLSVISGGLKVTLISVLYGMIIYLVSLVIRIVQKPRL